LPATGQLHFYARQFDCVEINSSFYHLPSHAQFESWRDQTPDTFLFAVKGSQYLTHMRRLRAPAEPLERLIQAAGGLGPKLGPILFQFPARFRRDDERLDQFLDALRHYARQRFAFEFRHDTWLTTPVYERLHALDAALCLPVGGGIPLDVRLTASWTYVRFHTGQHDISLGEDELRRWADLLRRFVDYGADVYAYFNNDPEAAAVHNARRLIELMSCTR
jgi:uncharacterized protein YecE (DUF72 family)